MVSFFSGLCSYVLVSIHHSKIPTLILLVPSNCNTDSPYTFYREVAFVKEIHCDAAGTTVVGSTMYMLVLQ